MYPIFTELSIILLIAAVLAYIGSLLRQPLIIGYILTGVLVGPPVWNLITATDTVTTLSQIGIALLLFMVGMYLNPRMIKNLGKISLFTGLGQIIFTVVIGYIIATWLGFSTIPALYLATAITFSSTIIIMKLLSDKGDLNSLYGRIAMGFLLVQDLVAVFLLMGISSTSNGATASSLISNSLLTGIGLIALLYIISKYLIPLIDGQLSKSTELLFLCSIAWCLVWASLFEWLGFSIEIGALLAGISLSMTDYGSQISARIRPLRDFFVVLFFILLGSTLEFSNLTNQELLAAGVFAAFVLIGNPLIVMLVMRWLKLPRHVGFLVGLTSAQISEFSLIVIALGVKLKHIESNIMTITTIIALVTIGTSSYMINYGNRIYK
ncbi:MAG: cation:proton antiporter [Candidatus Nanoarchaeia archaeon]